MGPEAQERVVIVTGASKGIGRAYAAGFGREGWSVVLASSSGSAEAEADALAAGAPGALSVPLQLNDPESIKAMAAAAVERFGRIDALVNNAAYSMALGSRRTSFDISIEEWDEMMAVNVRGSWLTSLAVHPTMKAQGGGRIVMTGSNSVQAAPPGFPHYVASKAALIGLTRALAREFGPDGIGVNCVTPDYIPLDTEYSRTQPHLDEIVKAGRAFSRTSVPEDMVGPTIFLASEQSSFVTGQTLLVNGGRLFL